MIIVGLFIMSVMLMIIVACALKIVPRQREHVYKFIETHEEDDEEEEEEVVPHKPTNTWTAEFYP
jgi:hypothetical protein